jgi:hypothetical protein
VRKPAFELLRKMRARYPIRRNGWMVEFSLQDRFDHRDSPHMIIQSNEESNRNGKGAGIQPCVEYHT